MKMNKEVRPDWNDKNLMQTTRSSYEGFTNGSGCYVKTFDQQKKILDCELFYLELKRHNASHIIFTI